MIGWADAAERIEELLDGGAFATNLEVTEAPRYERLGIAVDVWNLYHDFSDEASRWGICPAWVISIAPAFQRKRSV